MSCYLLNQAAGKMSRRLSENRSLALFSDSLLAHQTVRLRNYPVVQNLFALVIPDDVGQVGVTGDNLRCNTT